MHLNFFESGKPATNRAAPMASPHDPITSHIAAENIVKSGARDRQQNSIVEYLRSAAQPLTSKEIATFSGLDRHAAARRLPELEQLGLVARGPARPCTIGRGPAIVWSLVGRGQHA